MPFADRALLRFSFAISLTVFALSALAVSQACAEANYPKAGIPKQ
jgi:hypothetical protein